jgi:hypothetical protein
MVPSSPLTGEGWDEGGFDNIHYPSPYPLPQPFDELKVWEEGLFISSATLTLSIFYFPINFQ